MDARKWSLVCCPEEASALFREVCGHGESSPPVGIAFLRIGATLVGVGGLRREPGLEAAAATCGQSREHLGPWVLCVFGAVAFVRFACTARVNRALQS